MQKPVRVGCRVGGLTGKTVPFGRYVIEGDCLRSVIIIAVVVVSYVTVILSACGSSGVSGQSG